MFFISSPLNTSIPSRHFCVGPNHILSYDDSFVNQKQKRKRKEEVMILSFEICIYIYMWEQILRYVLYIYNQLFSLWFSLSQIRTLSPACVFSMDQRRVAIIEFHPQELTVKAKRCSRERVQLPPKRGRIKRQILSGLVNNFMKIMKCGS